MKYIYFILWVGFLINMFVAGIQKDVISEIIWATLSICALITAIAYRLEEIIKEKLKDTP